MKLSELKRIVDLSMDAKYAGDSDVMVRIRLPYATVGAMPMVAVKSAQNGFDWENGKFILMPEEDLAPVDRDFAEQMRDMQDKLGWAEYENRGLKAEIRQLKRRLGEQE
jgi:hypothetical protein